VTLISDTGGGAFFNSILFLLAWLGAWRMRRISRGGGMRRRGKSLSTRLVNNRKYYLRTPARA